MADRWSRLAVEAHVTGALDYARFHRYDRTWELRELLVFDIIEDTIAASLNIMAHDWHCAAAGSNPWDEEGKDFEYHRKEADKTFRTVGKLRLPWYKDWEYEDDRLVRLWQAFKNEEKDPQFQRWRDKTKKKLRKKTEDRQAEIVALRKYYESKRSSDEARGRLRRGRLRK